MKVRQALRAVRHGLAVKDDLRGWEGQHSGSDREEVGGPVASVAAPEPDVVTVLQRDDAEAVMLQLVDPLRPPRHPQGQDRLAWADEARRSAPIPSERRTHQHWRACNLQIVQSP
jgi:hypothetical protein